jgi:hypothetical protein
MSSYGHSEGTVLEGGDWYKTNRRYEEGQRDWVDRNIIQRLSPFTAVQRAEIVTQDSEVFPYAVQQHRVWSLFGLMPVYSERNREYLIDTEAVADPKRIFAFQTAILNVEREWRKTEFHRATERVIMPKDSDPIGFEKEAAKKAWFSWLANQQTKLADWAAQKSEFTRRFYSSPLPPQQARPAARPAILVA